MEECDGGMLGLKGGGVEGWKSAMVRGWGYLRRVGSLMDEINLKSMAEIFLDLA